MCVFNGFRNPFPLLIRDRRAYPPFLLPEFTWNARNQVATLNSVNLQYDAIGRRIKNAAGKSLLYDGPNAAQELSGSTVTANLLSGGIDEVFTRADSSGSFTPLQDALGNTVALVDSNGNIQTTYSYDPFGNTTTSNATSSNLSQYTGRENEGNGLYYYRARYYSPLLGRFISEDPIGFAGGLNHYAYVYDSPTNLADPSGRCPTCAPPPVEVPPVEAPPVVPFIVGEGAVASAAAAGEGAAPVLTLVAGGSAEGAGGGPVGALVGIIAVVGTYDVVQSYRLGIAYNWWGQPKPNGAPSLAGRYTGAKPTNNDDDDGCKREWKNARDYCSDLEAMPRNSPGWKNYINVWGGSLERCVRGQVSERCGGNRVN